MKNQYFGDEGDYGKYGLLRFLANQDIKIAVNWYLTDKDGSNDGKHTKYLEQGNLCKYDEELFELLKDMLSPANPVRNIIAFENKNMIPGAVYYHELLSAEGSGKEARCQKRKEWHEGAMEVCKDAELVFLDPDNGALARKPQYLKTDNKYCYSDEIVDYYNRGQNIVYYCSRGRSPYDEWQKMKSMMLGRLPDARLAAIAFHKGTCRYYIFVLHEKDFSRYTELLKQFVYKWSGLFTEENTFISTSHGNKTGIQIGKEDLLKRIALSILDGKPEMAQQTIRAEYPFQVIKFSKRNYTDKQKIAQFRKDGFIDRYSGQRLINPGLLRVLSYYFPEDFPFQTHWKMDQCHYAYWEFVPTIDHIVPVALGGSDSEENWATTSMLHNSIKSNWTLEQVGWTLHDPGKYSEWDGLTGIFIELVERDDQLLQEPYIKKWYSLSKR